MTKYRFVTEQNELGLQFWWTERRSFLYWDIVDGSTSSDHQLALDRFREITSGGTPHERRVIKVHP